MDFIQSSVTRSFGLSTATSGFGDSLPNMSSEENQRARVGHAASNQTSMQPLSPSSTLKSSRSAAGHAFLNVDDGDELGGPLKLSRRELYSCRQSDLSSHWTSGPNNGFALMRGGNSFMDDHSPWSSSSPTSAYSCDGILHGSHGYVMGDPRFLPRTDSVSSTSAYACSPRDSRLYRPFYPHQYSSAVCGNRSTSLFTASQWAELEDQALIFKYMMAGTTIPPHLLGPILKSLAAIRGFSSIPYHASAAGWGNFYPGVASNPDPEPGRCRRTDGKKWRCAREAVPDQKYCDRHIHRGRNRSRKLSENQALSSSSSHSSGVAVSSLTAASLSSPVTSTCASAAQTAAGLEHAAHGSNTRPTTITPSQQTFSTFATRNQLNSYNESAQQFLLPFQSASTEASMANKDHHRYGNGSCKDNAPLGSEQLFFSELACRDQSSPGQASTRCMQNRDMFRSLQGSALRRSFPDSLSPASQHDQSSGLLHQYSSSQRRNDIEFSSTTEGSDVEMAFPHEQQKSFLGGEYGTVNAASVAKESAEQPLRHFFDDWPRERDPSAISWMDQSEEEKSVRSGCGTQLSISIPMTSSDSPATSVSPSREKPGLPPLTLSMSRPVEEKLLRAAEQTQMKLGMSMALGMEDRHRQLPSVPITWEAPVGGPLAEMLQSSTPRGSSKPSSGLNLLCEGWESSPRDNPHNLSSRSPSAVLQTAAAASNGSCCSSPHGS
ncbi:hypothetical protein O6H91_08G012400 [Diphasiastrum complanatum]|uniref:Uncharacterized protein n=1 Tax=Diphasiastrum complanatum TaxID=34168 RepID=A0ACC2CUZ9_DIPCM|nr:hypothetical protein O6H91_Y386400 [Diphasiastrum complanatum]KAJ7278084.1 hypothetical protein O6H91_Y386400 [Diphasiastrum complanatum]KAJ7545834.1 hypothetical protein O6H91_08G012400 [Diphasiastrum complanatum]